MTRERAEKKREKGKKERVKVTLAESDGDMWKIEKSELQSCDWRQESMKRKSTMRPRTGEVAWVREDEGASEKERS